MEGKEQKSAETKLTELMSSVMDVNFQKYQTQILDQVKSTIDEKIEGLKAPVDAPKIEGGEPNLLKDQKGGFKALWQFASHVAKADKSNGRNVSRELLDWSEATKAAGTGMKEGDGEFGGYLIPPQFRNDLMVAVEHENQIIPMMTPVPMATNIIEIPAINGYDESGGTVWGGVQMTWTAEEAQYSEKRPKIEKIQLKLNKLTGLAFASDEVLSDSPISMEGILQRAFTNALNFEYNRVSIRGTGAGQPLGLLNAPCKVAVTAETGQSSGIWYENIINMRMSIWNIANSTWVANPNVLAQLASMTLTVGTGGVAVWMPAGGVAGREYDMLFGRPIIWCEHSSSLNTEGDIALVDWTQYLLARKSAGADDVRFDQSIHLKFDYGQVAFRLSTRLDMQPWWSTYYTPPQATTSYRSPIVTLATRS